MLNLIVKVLLNNPYEHLPLCINHPDPISYFIIKVCPHKRHDY